MKTLYTYLLMFLFTATALTGRAQQSGQLSGTLQDAKGNALGFGTVAVLKAADAAVVTGGVTDAEGRFSIPAPVAGQYKLRITAIGFQALETPAFEVTGPGFSKTFGFLALKEDVKALQEVKVEGLRPRVTMLADKMVVSVENTALAAGNTAYEVLAKSPGVIVDQDGNIQLNGKAGVRIMIDGKQTYLSGKELQTMLQGMSAENLKDLEIITNPSAKYDAEGTAGIININLKKNTLTGLNGNVYAGGQYNGLAGYSAGGTLNYKKGPWNSFVTADASRRTNMRDNTMTRVFNKAGEKTFFDQAGHEEGIRFIPSLRLGTDVDLNKKHSVGVMANLMHLQAENDFHTVSYKTNDNPAQDTLLDARNLISGRFYNATANAHYLGKLTPEGTTLSADVDVVVLRDQRDSRFQNYIEPLANPTAAKNELLTSDNSPRFNIYSAKMDYTRPFSTTTKMEMGAKASYVISDSDLDFFQVTDNIANPDPTRSSHFVYKEQVYAAYLNYNTNLGSKWSLQSGLRAEQTLGEGRLLVGNSAPISRKYLNLFPSVFFTQKVSKDYQVTYNYSRRISRPRYESLNPFIFFLDKYTSAQGNPYLRPMYTNSFQVSQMLKSTYNLTVGYAVTSDFMAEIPVQNVETNTTIFSQRNVDTFKNLSANLVAPVKISPKWDISNNLTLAQQDYTIELEGRRLRNQQLFLYVQSTSNIQLPKKFRLEATLAYQGASAYGLYAISPNWGMDLGLKRTFLEDKLDVSINGSDIFRTRQLVGKANYNGNINEFDQYFAQQTMRVNLRYRFSKGQQFDARRRNSSLEELNRAGGN